MGTAAYKGGAYLNGTLTLSYVYKGDALCSSIQNGVMWPLYDPLWSNGSQLMRNWGPLPLYALAASQALAAGGALGGIVIFACAVFAIGVLAWAYVGMKLKRPWVGLALGVLWFFLPNNLAILFSHGNLACSLSLAILPALLCLVYQYLKDGKSRGLVFIALLFALVVLCEPSFAFCVLAAVALYILCYGIVCRSWKNSLIVMASLVAGLLVAGFWMVPSAMHGFSAATSSQPASIALQNLLATLNPIAWLDGDDTQYCFGATATLVVVLGLLAAKRDAKAGFLCAAILVLFTAQSVLSLLSVYWEDISFEVPGVISVALALVLGAFVYWKTFKTPMVIAICVLFALECVPSLHLICSGQDISEPSAKLAACEESSLIAKAKEVTEQRLAVVGCDDLEYDARYLASGFGKPIAISEGSTLLYTPTDSDSAQLERALEEGDFNYLFDRSVELGDDSVLVCAAHVSIHDVSTGKALDKAARRSGFDLVAKNSEYRLYHRQTPAAFGVETTYRAIAIGTSAATLALQFPAFEKADSVNLCDYSFDDLKDYDVVFLGGFTYDDQPTAEELVSRLAENGTRVVIAADGIPADEHTGSKVFLGLDCEQITFTNGFPELKTKKGSLVTTLFPDGHEQWSCVYVNGIANPSAVIEEGDRTLAVCGSLDNPNIQVIGLNLTYYESLTRDANVAALLSSVLGVKSTELPSRKLVSLDVNYSASEQTLTIKSPQDDVNTTFAAQDIFVGNRTLAVRNNLLYVSKGETVIQMTYPNLAEGALASVAGVVCLVLLYRISKRREKKAAGEWV